MRSKKGASADTDWRRIADLYSLLLEIHPSPVVELNRAVAVAQAHGPAAGLELATNEAERRFLLRRLTEVEPVDQCRQLGR